MCAANLSLSVFLVLVQALALVACSDQTSNTGSAPVAVEPPEYLALRDGKVELQRGPLLVRIAPDVGGRIESLRYGGKERLITPAESQDMAWGNVLWTAPQSDWGWPPPPALDSAPYSVQVSSNGVRLTGATDPSLGVAVSKSYSLAQDTDTLVIHYQLHNNSNQDVTLAPWEVTRLPAKGRVFFPKGDSGYLSGQFAPLSFNHENGIAWFDYPADGLTAEHYKSMTDGEEGWLAYQADDWLFVKAFDNVPTELIAPGEGEIELYAKGDGSYIELEQQGYLATLMPGETLDWQVLWAFELLPEGEVRNNRELLLARARQLAGLALNSAD